MVIGALGFSGAALAFDAQGHRGARGLAPENTLVAFARALTIGVTTVELDVGVSRDGVVVIIHNRRFEPETARDADGRWLTAASPPIHALTLPEIKTYDVGRLNPATSYAGRYPEQVAVDGARVPTLGELFDMVREAGNTEVRFNIETKTSPLEPDATLAPAAFAAAVLDAVRHHGMTGRVTLQSFDWRTLQEVQRQMPDIPTSYLSAQQRWIDNIDRGKPGPSPWTAGFDIDDFGGSVPRLVKAAGGSVWSPFHKEIDAAKVAEAHDLGLTVKVWTVNEPDRMAALIAMGVDGIITDYPDRLRGVLVELGIAVAPPTGGLD